MTIYLVSLCVFSGVTFILVGILLLVENKVVAKGDKAIVINDDPEKTIHVPSNTTLLSALVSNGILIPSGCGGSGSCGMCKCVVEEGGGDVLPTELTHLSRREKQENVRISCQLKVKNDMKIRIPEEIFSIQKYRATVLSNRNVSTYIKEFIIRVDEDQEAMEFEAGAYIQIDIPPYRLSYRDFDIEPEYREEWDKYKLWDLKAGTSEPEFRAYSLANPPYEKNRLRLTVRIATPPAHKPGVPPGIGSSYIFGLKPGDKVEISGPYGDFFVKETDREMCFIGGGAGMAPMRCHILHQLNTLRTDRKCTFWYGARSVREMFYEEEFRDLEKEFPNFSFHVALSDPLPEDNWTGLTGFIHQCLFESYLKSHEDPTEIEYYLCGPPLMIDAVISMLDNLGVDPEMILYDKF